MTKNNNHPPISTPDLTAERLQALQELVPEVFSEGKIDFEKLRAALGNLVDDAPERYTFSWAGKRDAIRLLQTPTRATLVPAPVESLDFETTHNLFIEGDNLEVLKLLYKPYFGRVKMIYIDPPYNTGNDFIYPDDYRDPLGKYLELTGQQDAEGNLLTSNPETSGRYHSAWLSMMYPRLFLARQLLREDGVIFVSIDDHEVYNLRMLMNEIFGEENFIVCIVWQRRQVSDNRNLNNVSTDHEYVMAYGKGEAVFTGTQKDLTKYINPDNDPRGPWMSDNLTGLANAEERPNLHYDIINPETGIHYLPHPSRGWIYEPKTMEKLIEEGRILWPSSPDGRPRLKRFLEEIRSQFTGFSSLQEMGFNTDGTRELQTIFGEKVLPFPKPKLLILQLIRQATVPITGDIILDFFAGSATTAQAILEQNREDGGNRRFILVQLPEPTENPEFQTIGEIGKERIRRVIAKMQETRENGNQMALPLETRQTPEDLGFRVFKLTPSHFRPWVGVEEKEPQSYAQQMELFRDPLVEGWTVEGVLAELAIKHGFGLDYMVELRALQMPDAGEPTVNFYQVSDPERGQTFYACLAPRLTLQAVERLQLGLEDLVICRDTALDDETAANLALQCRLETI